MIHIIVALIFIILYFLVKLKKNYRLYRGKVDVTPLCKEIQKHGDVKVPGVLYENDNQIGSFKKGISEMCIRDILKHGNKSLQYKSDFSDNNPFTHAIGEFVKRDMGLNSLDGCVIRVCSSPWHYKAHFDCTDNYAVMMYGSKTFLLFDMYTLPIEKQRKILNVIKNTSIPQCENILKNYGISTDTIVLNEGDVLFIPSPIYHKVESREPSILFNYTFEGKVRDSHEKFSQLWPKQDKVCTNNNCLY
jgi:hypothetical protein